MLILFVCYPEAMGFLMSGVHSSFEFSRNQSFWCGEVLSSQIGEFYRKKVVHTRLYRVARVLSHKPQTVEGAYIYLRVLVGEFVCESDQRTSVTIRTKSGLASHHISRSRPRAY